MSRTVAALAAIVLAAFVPARSALACTPIAPGISGPDYWNAGNGAPRNVQLRLDYRQEVCAASGCLPVPDTLSVVRHDDPTVEAPGTIRLVRYGAHGQTVIWTPTPALDPATTYDLVAMRCLAAPCALATLTTFTTGMVIDTTPPTAPDLPTVSCARRDSCTSSSCCGPYEGMVAGIGFSGGTDDVGVVSYDVYQGGELVAQHVRGAPVIVSGTVVLYPPSLLTFSSVSGVSVVAVDAAGNVSPRSPVVTSEPVACPGEDGPPDAGLSGPRPRGCAVAGASPLAGAPLLLAIAALGLRRRTR